MICLRWLRKHSTFFTMHDQFILLLFIIFIFFAIAAWIKFVNNKFNHAPANPKVSQVTPTDRVPHCEFERTPDGFKITYRKPPFELVVARNIYYKFGKLVLIPLFIPLFVQKFYPTSIEVNLKTIKIGGRELQREEFGGFFVAKTYRASRGKIAELGYQYGVHKFAVAGAWKAQEAYEVVNALNYLLHVTPKV